MHVSLSISLFMSLLSCARMISEPDEAEDADIDDIKKIPQVVIAPPPGDAAGSGCELRDSVCKG